MSTESTNDQLIEQLVHFVGRPQMDIGGMGKTFCKKLVDAGIVTSVVDIFKLADRRAEMVALDGVGDKKVDTVLANIEDAKDRGMARILASFGWSGIGKTLSKSLAKAYPTLPMTVPAKASDLMALPGWGKKSAEFYVAKMQEESTIHLLNELDKLGVNLESFEYTAAQQHVDHPLQGKKFVLTGKMSRKRDEYAEQLSDIGAIVGNAVTGKTDVLVAGPDIFNGAETSSKHTKALELQGKSNIEIWSEQKLIDALAPSAAPVAL